MQRYKKNLNLQILFQTSVSKVRMTRFQCVSVALKDFCDNTKINVSTSYSFQYLRVLIIVSTRKHFGKYA